MAPTHLPLKSQNFYKSDHFEKSQKKGQKKSVRKNWSEKNSQKKWSEEIGQKKQVPT